MDLCEKIYEAKTCLVNLSTTYIKAKCKGRENGVTAEEISLFHSYIDSLERYQEGCNNCLNKSELCFILEQIALKCGNKCGC